MSDISEVTGCAYYSGNWQDIKNLAKSLKLGEGKISRITQTVVNYYQEMVDREIDSIVGELYHTPLLEFNQVQPDGTTKRIFPGNLRYLARMWVVGLLVVSEFQQLDPNISEQANQMLEESRRRMYNVVRYNQRLPGQEMRSNLSRTLPPSMQIGGLPELEG